MKTLVTLALAMSLVGCASIDVLKLSEYPQIQSPHDVQLISSRASVTRKFREIAMISVDDQGWERADSHVVGKMLEQARQIGADALILTDRETNSSGGAVVGNVWMSGNNKVMRGLAIVYEN